MKQFILKKLVEELNYIHTLIIEQKAIIKTSEECNVEAPGANEKLLNLSEHENAIIELIKQSCNKKQMQYVRDELDFVIEKVGE